MAEAIHTASDHIVKMPTYKTVNIWLHVYFPATYLPENSLYHLLPIKHHRTVRHNTKILRIINGILENSREQIRLVLSSTWARLDMQLHNFYSDIITGYHHTNNNSLSI